MFGSNGAGSPHWAANELVKDVQGNSTDAGAAQPRPASTTLARAGGVRWVRAFLGSWGLHGILFAAVVVLWNGELWSVSEGDQRLASVQVAQQTEVPEQLLEQVEPHPVVEEPEVHTEPELVEALTTEPEEIPEPLPVVEPLDWLPPRDLLSKVTAFKRPKAAEPELESETEPVLAPPEPEAPAPEPQTPTVLQGDDLPQVIKAQTPKYPRQAIRMHWEGTVVLRIQIDAQGQVVDVLVHNSSGHASLDTAAVRAFRNWVFRPRLEGEPDIRLLQKPFTFRLG